MKWSLFSVGVSVVCGVSVCARVQEPVKVDGGLITGRPSWGWNVRACRGNPTRVETILAGALHLFSGR